MHLTALRIRGFKSFAETVELRFFPGVAVIVGPNGSGKSNIADAIQWVMASQPPSQLRAETGQDVLFAGSDRRGASGLCEVELVLANPDGRIALPQAEVSVMRRLRREGDSEYLLARSQVRRLDVQEALADAGLGRELHCIISQGSVDEILLARPDERRGLVEEAAGLGKYKRRRRRAEQKLARVRLDLERAADVEKEIRSRLAPLRLQATAAERAEKLGRELAEGRLLLLASEAAAARTRRTALTTELTAARAERDRLEAVLTAARGRREAAEEELASLGSAQEKASARFWALGSALERLQSRRDGVLSQLSEAGREAARANERAERLAGDAAARRAEGDEAAERAETLQAEAARLRPDDEERLRTLAAQAEVALESALEARRAAARAEGGAARATAEHGRLTGRAAELERSATEAQTAAGALQQDAETAAAALREAAPTAAKSRAAQAAAEHAAGAAHATAEIARGRLDTARAAASVASEQAAAASARVEALEAALRRADGVAPAVRRLAEAGATLALSLVRPQPGLELAAAAALARRAATAVTDDLAAALELLDVEGVDGASVLVQRAVPERETPVAPPGATPLTELVALSPEAPPGLLAGVFLVEDARAFETIGSGLAVTRDGLGFDASRGVVFRSGQAGEAALLEARAELEDALLARDRLEREAAQAAEAAAAAGTAHDAAAETEKETAGALRDASDELAAAERAEHDAAAARDRALLDAERALARARSAAAELDDVRRAAADAEREAASLGEERAEAEARATEAEAGHRVLEQQRHEEAARLATLRAERAALGERADRASEDARRARAAADTAATSARRARARAARLAALSAFEPAFAGQLDACLAAGSEARTPARAALDAFEQRARDLSAALAACRAEESEAERGLRGVGERATALEVEGAHVEERLNDARRRSREVAERHGLAPVEATAPLPADEAAVLAAKLERLERRRAELGAVNPLARQEYEEQLQRAEDVAEQRADLEASLRELDTVIAELSQTIRERFAATYTQVEEGFADVVQTLFPGGRGRLRLVEAGDEAEEEGEPAEPGIELEVQPAGKRIGSLALLSGGEKALAALAFLFALFLARPSPFYVLDEVDAPLDDANIERFLALLERYRDEAQFIVITHQKRTMEVADVLYGVTMAGDGISRVLSRKVPESTRRAFEPIA